MRHNGQYLWYLASVILLIGCGDLSFLSKDTGGATETTNGIVLADKRPVPKAIVKLIAQKDWIQRIQNKESVVLDSTQTQDDGKFTLIYPKDIPFNLEIISQHQGLFIPSFQNSTNGIDTFFTKKVSTIQGPYTAVPQPKKAIHLEGTSISIPLTSNSVKQAISIPIGVFNLAIVNDLADTSDIQFFRQHSFYSHRSISLDSLVSTHSGVLIDDFSKETVSSLTQITNQGNWYTFDDKDFHLDKIPSTLTLRQSSTQNAFVGQSLLAQVKLRSQTITEEPYVGIGYFLGVPNKWYDLSNLTAISFMARGKGKLKISLESYTLDTLLGQKPHHFEKVINIKEQWEPIIISVDELTVLDYSPAHRLGIQWKDVADKIARIEFLISGWDNPKNTDLEFQLDNLYFQGISTKDLINPILF